jgi:DNA-binding response OmpR family regulator
MDRLSATADVLKGRKVLVVEDEPFIALDLAFGIEQAGGIPLGPATSIAEALSILEDDWPDGAILDADLPDGSIEPVLKVLRPSVPVVVHTGVGLPDHLRQIYADLPVFSKPTAMAVLLRNLL